MNQKWLFRLGQSLTSYLVLVVFSMYFINQFILPTPQFTFFNFLEDELQSFTSKKILAGSYFRMTTKACQVGRAAGAIHRADR